MVAFLAVAGASLRLHADKAWRGAAHRFTHVAELNPSMAPAVHFGDVANLGLGDPVTVSDHPRLTVPVHFATIVGDADRAVVEGDVAGFSRRLQEDGRLGSLEDRRRGTM